MTSFTTTRRAIALCLLAAASLGSQTACGQEKSEIASPSKAPDLRTIEAGIVERTNQFRKEKELPAVETNDQLTATARTFAKYMADNHRYGHEADGRTAAERTTAEGYKHCLVLENIAYRYSSRTYTAGKLAEELTQGWIDSPGHRENMLNESITQTGVGLARGKSGYYFAVQLFGLPESARMTFQVANRVDAELKYKLGEQEFKLPPRVTMTHERCTQETIVVQPGEVESLTVTPEGSHRYTLTRDAQGKLTVEDGGAGSAVDPASEDS